MEGTDSQALYAWELPFGGFLLFRIIQFGVKILIFPLILLFFLLKGTSPPLLKTIRKQMWSNKNKKHEKVIKGQNLTNSLRVMTFWSVILTSPSRNLLKPWYFSCIWPSGMMATALSCCQVFLILSFSKSVSGVFSLLLLLCKQLEVQASVFSVLGGCLPSCTKRGCD